MTEQEAARLAAPILARAWARRQERRAASESVPEAFPPARPPASGTGSRAARPKQTPARLRHPATLSHGAGDPGCATT